MLRGWWRFYVDRAAARMLVRHGAIVLLQKNRKALLDSNLTSVLLDNLSRKDI